MKPSSRSTLGAYIVVCAWSSQAQSTLPKGCNSDDPVRAIQQHATLVALDLCRSIVPPTTTIDVGVSVLLPPYEPRFALCRPRLCIQQCPVSDSLLVHHRRDRRCLTSLSHSSRACNAISQRSLWCCRNPDTDCLLEQRAQSVQCAVPRARALLPDVLRLLAPVHCVHMRAAAGHDHAYAQHARYVQSQAGKTTLLRVPLNHAIAQAP